MSYMMQWCTLRGWAKLISHKFEMSDSKTQNRCSQWLICRVPFTQLFLPVLCIQALITVIFLELTLDPPLQTLILLFGLFYGLSEIPSPLVQKYYTKSGTGIFTFVLSQLACSRAKSNAGVIRNHLCLSCLITPSSATSKRLFLWC